MNCKRRFEHGAARSKIASDAAEADQISIRGLHFPARSSCQCPTSVSHWGLPVPAKTMRSVHSLFVHGSATILDERNVPILMRTGAGW